MKLKKVYIYLMALLLAFGLFACGNDNNKIIDRFESANLISLGNNISLNKVDSDLEVVIEFEKHEITWTSDHANLVVSGNKLFVTRDTDEDILVNLSAKIKLKDGQELERKFEVSILKNDGGNEVDRRRGTFNRLYPEYYETGVPIIENAHVVYINWDGFAQYYLDAFFATEEGKQSTLYKLKNEGIYFDNLRNTFPSLTNPVQNQILSGGTSLITKNIYRYYDKKTNSVIQQLRENEAPILPEVTAANNISTVSFSMYLAERHLTNNDINKLYVTSDPTNPKVIARGEAKSNDHFARMEQAIKMFKGEPVKVNGEEFIFNEIPKFTLIYADDTDAVGHNERDVYGYNRSLNEVGRMENILTLVKEMDEKLGELIQAAKDRGVYDKLTFFLTTDHGMSPFGSRGVDETHDYGGSKLRPLIAEIEAFNSNYILERVQAGQTPSRRTTIVGVTGNLNMYMTFKNEVTELELLQLKEHIQSLPYIYEVYTREQLKELYMDIKDVDLLVVPGAHYHFTDSLPTLTISARGQHDTTLDTSNKVLGLIWGNGIKKNEVFEGQAFNYDFGITMAAVLGVDLPDANGIVLDIFERE